MFVCVCMLFLVAQMVKNLPAIRETQVQSLGQEDPLEKRKATQSSILPRKIPQTEDPGGLQSVVHKGSDMTEWLIHTYYQYICIYLKAVFAW